MWTLGTDISHWEGNINWQIATPYLGFGYYKATDGEDFIDSEFGDNQDGCDETGLPHAPFHWWQELENPEVQADFFFEITQGTYKKRIVDVEPRVSFPGIVDKLERHLHRVEALQGFKPTIYTSKNYLNSFILSNPPWAEEYEFIIAQYTYRMTLIPAYVLKEKVKAWQFTDTFYFPGCEEIADGNWFFDDLPNCRDWFGNYHPFAVNLGGKTRMIVLINGLHIRTEPSLSAPEIGHLNTGDIIEVLDVTGNDAWVRHKLGWSAAKIGNYDYMNPLYQTSLPIIVK